MENQDKARKKSLWNYATVGIGVLMLVVVIYTVVTQIRSASSQLVTVGDLLNYMGKSGLAIGESAPVDDVEGAAHSVRVSVGGGDVYFFKFDTTDKDQVARLAEVQQAGSIMADGVSRPTIVNGSIVMAGLEGHPRAAQIRQVFLSFSGSDAAQRPIGTRGSGTRS